MNDYSKLKVYENEADAKAAYVKGLDLHRSLVHEAFNRYGEIFCKSLEADLEELKKLIDIHDQSRYDDEIEVRGFLANRYPYKDDGIGDSYGLRRSIYEKALAQHFKNNPHHSEYWLTLNPDTLTYEAKAMDKVYICEMVIDWIAYKNMLHLRTVGQYWGMSKVNKYIHKDTRADIETLMNLIDE